MGNLDLTVVYYTANREKPEFEGKICQTLLEATGDCPLISVSQKPMDLGRNICVGDVGFSEHNAFRQMQIGIQEAKTRFVCTAESDALYPKERFQFVPDDDQLFYLSEPMVVLRETSPGTWKYCPLKWCYRESAATVGKSYILASLDRILSDRPTWQVRSVRPRRLPHLYMSRPEYPPSNRACYKLPVATITMRTAESLHWEFARRMPTEMYDELPHWGKAGDLARRYRG